MMEIKLFIIVVFNMMEMIFFIVVFNMMEIKC